MTPLTPKDKIQNGRFNFFSSFKTISRKNSSTKSSDSFRFQWNCTIDSTVFCFCFFSFLFHFWPQQLIQLFSSLMDALKVSFSQRSTNARSLGHKDPFSDAAVAAVTIMKVTTSQFCREIFNSINAICWQIQETFNQRHLLDFFG